MDKEGKFWSVLWTIVGTFLIIMVALGQGCYYKEMTHELALVKEGVPLMDIRCSSQSESEEAACMAYALGAPE